MPDLSELCAKNLKVNPSLHGVAEASFFTGNKDHPAYRHSYRLGVTKSQHTAIPLDMRYMHNSRWS